MDFGAILQGFLDYFSVLPPLFIVGWIIAFVAAGVAFWIIAGLYKSYIASSKERTERAAELKRLRAERDRQEALEHAQFEKFKETGVLEPLEQIAAEVPVRKPVAPPVSEKQSSGLNLANLLKKDSKSASSETQTEERPRFNPSRKTNFNPYGTTANPVSRIAPKQTNLIDDDKETTPAPPAPQPIVPPTPPVAPPVFKPINPDLQKLLDDEKDGF